MVYDILITHIKGLVQVREKNVLIVKGSAMADLPVLYDAFLLIHDGLIHSYGGMQELPKVTALNTIDASGRFVFPSYVDSHTHLVFAATREEEFVMKIKGASYADIAAKGGGILNSAKKLQAMSEEELFQRAVKRAWEIISTGTGAVEIKSGYGLTTRDELKMLRVARRIGNETPLTVKTTFLGAHAVPAGMEKKEYIRLVIEEMIPAVAEENLADYIDVFCETGFFTEEETIQIAEAGKQKGMTSRIHANQLNRSGGVQAGVKSGAISVDHLENIGEEEINVLKDSKTMPVSLPGAAFFLRLPYTPARQIIDAGLPLALASDYNPGSAPSGNMSFILSLACIQMKMTPEEAFNATTINTAYTLGLSDSMGSITTGNVANLWISQPVSSLAAIPYSYGKSLTDQIILNGKIVSPYHDTAN